MAFKMKGHTLPGIKQRSSTKMADGRPSSSPLQTKGDKKGTKTSKRLLTPDEMKKRKINPKKDTEYYIDNKGSVVTVTNLESSPAKQGLRIPKDYFKKEKKYDRKAKGYKFPKGKSQFEKDFEKIKETKNPGKGGKVDRDSWQPAFEGADHSKKELKKMTKKQKEDYYN